MKSDLWLGSGHQRQSWKSQIQIRHVPERNL